MSSTARFRGAGDHIMSKFYHQQRTHTFPADTDRAVVDATDVGRYWWKLPAAQITTAALLVDVDGRTMHVQLSKREHELLLDFVRRVLTQPLHGEHVSTVTILTWDGEV